MYRCVVQALLVSAFAAAAGHVAWWTYFCPLPAESVAVASPKTLRAPNERIRNLYVRHNLHLPERPLSGWIRVRGPDLVELYINGDSVGFRESTGTDTTIVVDSTRLLREGKNVLAAVCRQSTLDRVPELAIEGEYVLSDGLHRIGVDDAWRCWSYYERTNDYWFANEFDDSHWPRCVVGQVELLVHGGPVEDALIMPSQGGWIAPDEISVRRAVLRRMFNVRSPIKHAWVRLQSNASYRLAINGVLMSRQEKRYGTDIPVSRGRVIIYDVSRLIRVGNNRLLLRLDAPAPPPQVAVEIHLQLQDGSTHHLAGHDQWVWRNSTLSEQWLADAAGQQEWRACQAVDVIKGCQPWEVVRTIEPISWPIDYQLLQYAKQALLTVVIALCAWFGAVVARRLSGDGRRVTSRCIIPLQIIALFPATLLLIAAIVVPYDPRFVAAWSYNPLTLNLALGMVLMQWVCIGAATHWSRMGRRGNRADSKSDVRGLRSPHTSSARLVWVAVLILFAAGTYLRYRDVAARPLSPDEVTSYEGSVNVWKYGFPTILIHEDIPPVPSSTSELVYYGNAVTAIFTDNDRLIARFVPALFGSITILLVFWAGARMFHPWVGVAAAAIYAFSPPCISMSNVGRYYSQVQFFALLVTYQFWRTIEPRMALNHRALWCTVASYLAMVLSWEGSALLALPMMIAAVVDRRSRMSTILCNKHVWIGVAVVGSALLLQSGHRTLMQTARPLIGSGASDVTITPMWRYPEFDPWRYVPSASWNNDALFPAVGLVLALLCLVVKHPWRRPMRLLLIVFLIGGLAQASFVSVTASRYSRHYIPHLVLLGASATVLMTRGILRQRLSSATFDGVYSRAILNVGTTAFVALSCGLLLDLNELRNWRVSNSRLKGISVPGQQVAASYLKEHWRPGDAVIVDAPHVIEHYFGGPVDYWLESQLHLQAVFDDKRPIPLHRLKGAIMLRDVDHLREVFARHDRVWLVTEPSVYPRTNTPEVAKFVRENMDVVFEDYKSLVLLKDDAHRSAVRQQRTERSLNRARVHVP